MNKKIVWISIALAALNIVLGLINAKWYLVAAAVFLSLLVFWGALKYLCKSEAEHYRSFAWHNIISGLSILSLSLSSFFGLAVLGFAQTMIAAVLVVLGGWALYQAVKMGGLELIP